MSIANTDNVFFEDGYYGVIVGKGDKAHYVAYGRDFQIEHVKKNFEDRNVVLYLSTTFAGSKIFGQISLGEISAIGISYLSKLGFDFKNSALDVVQYAIVARVDLFLEEHNVELSHSGIGWQYVDEENEEEGLLSPLGMVYKSYDHVGNLKSEYNGKFDIKPHGSYKNQIAFVKKEIVGFIPIEAAFIIGLSAVVVGLVRSRLNMTNLFVNFIGDSSRGKSTAAMVAISVAGTPNISDNSLARTWLSTGNAIISRLKSNNGMPVLFDEVSQFIGSDLTTLIYSFSQGVEKDRLNRDGSLKDKTANDFFSTTIISTGESRVLSKCRKNTGLKVRVREINAQFTRDAAHADRLKQGAMENNGWLAPALAKYLESIGMDEILSVIDKWRNEYKKNSTIDTLKDRISLSYAVILAAGEFAEKAFGLKLNIKEILDFFIEHEEEDEPERDISIIAYEKLTDYVMTHKSWFNVFEHGTVTESKMPVVYGRIDEGVNKTIDGKPVVSEFCFTEAAFERITNELGFEDTSVILKALKKKNFLNHEKNKSYRKRKLGKNSAVPMKMYVLYIFDDENIFKNDFIELDDKDNPFSGQPSS